METCKLQTKMLQAIASGEGLPSLAKIMMYFFKNQVIITDSRYKILTYQAEPEASITWGEFLPLLLPNKSDYLGRKTKVCTGEIRTPEEKLVSYVSMPLIQVDLEGFIFILLTGQPWQDDFNEPLRQAALAILVELSKEFEIRNVKLQHKNEFIHDVLYNNFENKESLIYHGKVLGWDLSQTHLLAVVKLDEEYMLELELEEKLEHLHALFSVYLTSYWNNAKVARRGRHIILFIPYAKQVSFATVRKDMDVLLTKCKEKIYCKLPTSISVGIGHLYSSSSELYRSFQEAKTALELGNFFGISDAITYFDEIGILGLIYRMGEQDLKGFCLNVLGPLISCDEAGGSQVLETLEVYFQCNEDLNETAKKLFIHVNTLRYRLRKVEELLGMDISKLNVRLNLYTALCIYNQKDWKEII